MGKPRLLDLFCGAGGAAMGYHRAGFEVVGVDIKPQPNYPFEFVQQDALQLLADLNRGWGASGDVSVDWYDAIHASPPCQAYSPLSALTGNSYPDLVAEVRNRLRRTGLPYVIENVIGAPLEDPIRLCGSSFGLNVWRHRLFESSIDLGMVPPCSHGQHPHPIDVTGTGGRRTSDRTTNGGNSRKPRTLQEAQEAMGIDWMTRAEMAQAIPPAYTEHIGHYLMTHLKASAEEGIIKA